ncbi:50S ribosomal protein L6 [Candidatus Wolfebacteria bacterium CG03_land_8_20_14_0_80_40_12]|uniref:50S ribosomal protein L6 n=1 Tax=Candidatus Wolfebacteria bacterium CG03_land_8_20_14_0_80_40_12 TaxID=1975069 RepID=A0A2M7B6F0_9BACT|nr:MAG: 50S ribosomal protein L6 [Candidatus Wolfebacteria bacterium CG03_land_8_20_14_0_80_40_12]
MSKIGKKPISIPDNVEVKISDGFFEFKKENVDLKLKILPYLKIEIKDKAISIGIKNNSKQAKSNWGTMRSLVNNTIIGIIKGFEKKLEIDGVGYRASMEKNDLVLNIGYSHPVKFVPPDGIKILVDKNTITISGVDKAIVGNTAAKIRALKKPEPYKGKGIRYQGEIIKRKAGKRVAAATK